MDVTCAPPFGCLSPGIRLGLLDPFKIGLRGYAETSLNNYRHALRNDPERRSHIFRGESLKSRISTRVINIYKYAENAKLEVSSRNESGRIFGAEMDGSCYSGPAIGVSFEECVVEVRIL